MLESKAISFSGKLVCFIICLLPITLGFIIPVLILLNFVLSGFSIINFSEVTFAATTSISLAFGGAITVMLISIILVIVSNYRSNTLQKGLIFVASCGYALPGTILAVGIVIFFGWLNKIINFDFF